jgi:hypothetical protein
MCDMPTVEERIAALEAKVDTMADLRMLIGELRGDMNRQIGELRGDMNAAIAGLRGDMNARFAQVDSRFTHVEQRFTDVDSRIDLVDAKIDRHFAWLMVMMLTGFIAIIGALIGVVYR